MEKTLLKESVNFRGAHHEQSRKSRRWALCWTLRHWESASSPYQDTPVCSRRSGQLFWRLAALGHSPWSCLSCPRSSVSLSVLTPYRYLPPSPDPVCPQRHSNPPLSDPNNHAKHLDCLRKNVERNLFFRIFSENCCQQFIWAGTNINLDPLSKWIFIF